jgi:hypothetical protein
MSADRCSNNASSSSNHSKEIGSLLRIVVGPLLSNFMTNPPQIYSTVFSYSYMRDSPRSPFKKGYVHHATTEPHSALEVAISPYCSWGERVGLDVGVSTRAHTPLLRKC